MLVTLNNAEKYYGPHQVFDNVTLVLHAGDRIGLVGRNGAGKTTLLRLLTGEEQPDGGAVRWAGGVEVRALQQDPKFPKGATVDSVLDAAFHTLDKLEAELEAAAEAMSSGSEASIMQHERVLEQFERRGGLQRRSRKDAAAHAFGFAGRGADLAADLSGGERTRLGLAALLVESPDVLLLDEPTNHLDTVMVEWLENFLGRYKGVVLVISHDRAFLDHVTRETAYLRDGSLKRYTGGYTRFRETLAQELETQAAQYASQQGAIAALQKSTDRMKIWGLGMSKLARRAKSMESRLSRMQAGAVAPPPAEERRTRITFHAPESGEIVLDAEHLTRAVDTGQGRRTLFEGERVQIRRGERIAIVGRNGAGKTTLLRTLLGLDPSDDPRAKVRLGARVSLGYYDQQLRGVDPAKTLFDLARAYTEKDSQAHTLLGTYLFPYQQHDKQAGVLSGGERARLALLRLAQEDHNFLVMDEPTNHLDIFMLEALETALAEYAGTLLMVSHDRSFIEALADQVWVVEGGQVYRYLGWEEYRERHPQVGAADLAAQAEAEEAEETEAETEAAEESRAEDKAAGNPEFAAMNSYQLGKQLEATEGKVAELEAAHQAAALTLAHADANADFAELGREVSRLEAELEAAMERWAALGDELERRQRG